MLMVLWLTARSAAQCQVRDTNDALPPPLPTVNSSTRQGEPRLPESGYLSNTSYANAFFGLVMDLPIPLEGHRMMLPLMPPGQHALLAMAFQQGRRSGTLVVTASEPLNPVHQMTGAERNAEFQAWAKGEPKRQITPPDWMTRTNRFYHIVRRKNDVTTVQYWTFIRNYLVRIKVESNDRGFLAKTKQAVADFKFYCTQEDGTLINQKGEIVPTRGEAYQGPTIPTAVVNAALDEQPALEQIERGEVAVGTYRNEEMGLTYTFPTVWEAVPGEPDPPAEDDAAQRARDVLSACSLMLLQLTPRPTEGANAVGRMITLRAIDQACLSLPAPASVTDRLGAEKLGAYLQMLGAVGELRSTNLAMRANHLFAEYGGVVGNHPEGQPLANRSAEAVAITRHRKLLLVWSWIAPTPAELGNMPKTSVSFEDAAPIELVATAVMTKR
jgi:hypothetical protein